MDVAGPALGHEHGDDLAVRLPKPDQLLQAHLCAVHGAVPARVVQPGHVPAPLQPVVEHEQLAQERTQPPIIRFSLVGPV